jgi:hypothetical protein
MKQSHSLIRTFSVFVFFSVLLFILQLCVDGFVGVDAYYHVRLCDLIIRYGFFNRFPWTQISIWRDQFADKEFLFHLYLVPFILIFSNPIIGAKVAISILGGVFFSLFYRILSWFNIDFAFLWALILFSGNIGFLKRICMIRPHVLSLILILLLMQSLFQQQSWKILIISVIYPLSYTAAHFPVFIIAIYIVVSFIYGREHMLKLLLLSLAGTFLGLLIHPHFPNNLYFWYVQNILLHVFNWGKGQEFWFVSELKSLPVWVFVEACGLIVFLLVITTILLVSNRNLTSREFLFIFTLSLCFLPITMFSIRFIEYWIPFTILACALAVQVMKPVKSTLFKFAVKVGLLGIVGSSLLMYVIAILLAPVFFESQYSLKGPADWLRNNTPPKSIVFTTDWSNFPQLFYFNPQNYYLFGLDPVYCYAYDANLWNLWVAIVSGKVTDSYNIIKKVFHADYVLCPKDQRSTAYVLTKQLMQDARAEVCYQDERYCIFALLSR